MNARRAERGEGDEHDGRQPALCGERGALRIECEAAAEEPAHACEASADAAATARERAEHDRERREVRRGHRAVVGAERAIDRLAEAKRGRDGCGPLREGARQRRGDLRERELERQAGRERRSERVDERRQRDAGAVVIAARADRIADRVARHRDPDEREAGDEQERDHAATGRSA